MSENKIRICGQRKILSYYRLRITLETKWSLRSRMVKSNPLPRLNILIVLYTFSCFSPLSSHPNTLVHPNAIFFHPNTQSLWCDGSGVVYVHQFASNNTTKLIIPLQQTYHVLTNEKYCKAKGFAQTRLVGLRLFFEIILILNWLVLHLIFYTATVNAQASKTYFQNLWIGNTPQGIMAPICHIINKPNSQTQ